MNARYFFDFKHKWEFWNGKIGAKRRKIENFEGFKTTLRRSGRRRREWNENWNEKHLRDSFVDFCARFVCRVPFSPLGNSAIHLYRFSILQQAPAAKEQRRKRRKHNERRKKLFNLQRMCFGFGFKQKMCKYPEKKLQFALGPSFFPRFLLRYSNIYYTYFTHQNIVPHTIAGNSILGLHLRCADTRMGHWEAMR